MKLRLLVHPKSLRTRVFLLSMSGLLVLLVVLGLSSYHSVQKSQEQLLSERLLLAQTVADNLESLIGQNLSYLQNTAFFPGWNPDDETLNPERLALHAARLQSFFSHLFLLDQNGELIWMEPQSSTENSTLRNSCRSSS